MAVGETEQPRHVIDPQLVGTRLALTTWADPRDRSIFSGMPASLFGALDEVVGEVVPISGAVSRSATRLAVLTGVIARSSAAELLRPRDALSRRRDAALWGQPMMSVASTVARVRLALAGHVSGCVLLSTEFAMPASLRFVTFQDSTLVQALRSYAWPHLRGWSERDHRVSISRQRTTYRRSVACTAMSHWAADSIVRDYGVDPAKVHVVGLGPNQPARRRAQRDWAQPRFLFVGFDWTRKNGDAVLKAFAQIRAENPEATLSLVGGHPRVDLEGVTGYGSLSLASDRDRAQLGEIYDRATALVLPSLHDPSPTVHLEAGHAGIASIGSASGGAQTVIGAGGYVVDPDRPRGAAQRHAPTGRPEACRGDG